MVIDSSLSKRTLLMFPYHFPVCFLNYVREALANGEEQVGSDPARFCPNTYPRHPAMMPKSCTIKS